MQSDEWEGARGATGPTSANKDNLSVESSAASLIGNTIRRERKRRRLTQPDLAFAAGVSARALHQVENGKETSRLDIIARILDALDLRIQIEPRPQGPQGATGPMIHRPFTLGESTLDDDG